MSVFPLASDPVARSYPPANASQAWVDLVESSEGSGQYLLEILTYIGGITRSGGLATVAEIPVASNPPNSGVNTGQITLTYADRNWVGEPDAVNKANVFYEDRVTDPLTASRTIPILPEQERRVQRQLGEVVIANGDGALDQIVLSYAVDGRQVRILYGPLMGAYEDFKLIADVVATGWDVDDLSVKMKIQDRSFSLDLPLQTSLYSGAGGANGTVDIQGKPVPLTFGRCRNVAPLMVDPANLIYQVHDGLIQAIDGVFDRGLALTAASDRADYAALSSASISSGQYDTCLALGLFRLGGSPSGLVTADVRGDATGGYADTLDVICLRILKTWHGLDPSFIDDSTFAGAAAIAGELGIHITANENPTTSQVINALIGSTAGWWGAARDGHIRAGRLSPPEDRTASLRLDQFNVLSVEPSTVPLTRWRQRVMYRRNWVVQRGEDLAGSVTDTRRQLLAEPGYVFTAADVSVKVRHLRAEDPAPLVSLYENEADAETLADFLLNLHSADRQLVFVPVKRLGYKLDLQQVVHLTWPRFGLSNGKNFMVVGIEESAVNDLTTLILWG